MCRLNELGSDYSPQMTGETSSSSICHHPSLCNGELEPVSSALSGKRLGSSGVKAAPVGRMIKTLLSCRFMQTRAKVKRRSEGREEREKENKQSNDGGWKWLEASVLCECLCAAFAKENKA